MTLQYLTGDATRPIDTGGQRYLIHICNSVGGWGRGFVVAVSKRWAEPEAAYRRWFRYGNCLDAGPFELGGIQLVPVSPTLTVVNMIAQQGYGPGNKAQHQDGGVNDTPPIRYDALESCLSQVNDLAHENQATVHGPRFGAGLAAGDWSRIEGLIRKTIQAPVYIYDLV